MDKEMGDGRVGRWVVQWVCQKAVEMVEWTADRLAVERAVKLVVVSAGWKDDS